MRRDLYYKKEVRREFENFGNLCSIIIKNTRPSGDVTVQCSTLREQNLLSFMFLMCLIMKNNNFLNIVSNRNVWLRAILIFQMIVAQGKTFCFHVVLPNITQYFT